MIDAVIEIVRKQKMEDGTDKYGATFIGMSDTDAIKIDFIRCFVKHKSIRDEVAFDDRINAKNRREPDRSHPKIKMICLALFMSVILRP